jgi:hypothetical protein
MRKISQFTGQEIAAAKVYASLTPPTISILGSKP